MTIEVLYPEICTLFGDKANARYLSLCLPDAEFLYTPLSEEPAFVTRDVNMVYLASMSESSQQLVIDALMPYRDRLRDMINGGVVILATGNAFEVFGQKIDTEKGETIPALELLPFRSERTVPKRDNSLFLGTFGEQIIVGYTSRFAHSYYLDGAQSVFTAVKGYGMNREEKREGIRQGNCIGTHLLGPLLIQNPDFTKYLLSLLGAGDRPLPYEQDVYEAFRVRLEELQKDIEFYD